MKDAKKILVIDDDRLVIELVGVALNGPEYRAILAPNPWAGLQLAQAFPPALILCDSSMPYVGGTQLFKLLRADPRTRHIPFVLMIGDPDSPVDGVDGVLHKPFCADELRTIVRTLTTFCAVTH